jgi:polysaccharide export outer membrane protein
MKNTIIYIIAILIFSSCRMINPSEMLKTDRDYPFTKLSDQQNIPDYRIAPDDKISFNIYTNNGEKIIEQIDINAKDNKSGTMNALSYLVEKDSMVNMPVIGRVKLGGLTLKEAEAFLVKQYAVYYVQPFVQLNVINRRVLIFPGSLNGEAKVLYLTNAHTTLLEAIAQAGGIGGGKANKVKLIRGNLKNPDVYLFDLSTIDGVKKADVVLQANDIIYIESRSRVMIRFAESLAPYITLLSAVVLAVTFFRLK